MQISCRFSSFMNYLFSSGEKIRRVENRMNNFSPVDYAVLMP